MLDRVPDGPEVAKAADLLLRKSGAYGRWPTPVDDIVAAAGLVEPMDSLLSPGVVDQAPEHLKRAMRKISGKVLALLDRQTREIHLDPAIHVVGQRSFKKLHEVSHDMCAWQHDLAYADDHATLSPLTHRTFERQANAGAAELLFQRERFGEIAREYAVGMASVVELSNLVGSSLRATLHRYVEVQKRPVVGVVLEISPTQRNPFGYRRLEANCSKKWETKFGDSSCWPQVLFENPFQFVTSADEARTSRTTVQGQQRFPDVDNTTVKVQYELLSNSYNVLLLMWVPGRELGRRKRIVVAGRP